MSIYVLNQPYHWNSYVSSLLYLLLGYSAEVEQGMQDFLSFSSWPIKLLESQVLKLGHGQPYNYSNNLYTMESLFNNHK